MYTKRHTETSIQSAWAAATGCIFAWSAQHPCIEGRAFSYERGTTVDDFL